MKNNSQKIKRFLKYIKNRFPVKMSYVADNSLGLTPIETSDSGVVTDFDVMFDKENNYMELSVTFDNNRTHAGIDLHVDFIRCSKNAYEITECTGPYEGVSFSRIILLDEQTH